MEFWGRCSFAHCLIEVKENDVFKESITLAIPLIDGEGFNVETVRVEYEWKPPWCDLCMDFGHSSDSCPKKVLISTLNVEKTSDGFQRVGKRQGGKSGGAKGGGRTGISVGSMFQYMPKECSNTCNVATSKSENTKTKNVNAKVDSNVSKKGNETIGSASKIFVNTVEN